MWSSFWRDLICIWFAYVCLCPAPCPLPFTSQLNCILLPRYFPTLKSRATNRLNCVVLLLLLRLLLHLLHLSTWWGGGGGFSSISTSKSTTDSFQFQQLLFQSLRTRTVLLPCRATHAVVCCYPFSHLLVNLYIIFATVFISVRSCLIRGKSVPELNLYLLFIIFLKCNLTIVICFASDLSIGLFLLLVHDFVFFFCSFVNIWKPPLPPLPSPPVPISSICTVCRFPPSPFSYRNVVVILRPASACESRCVCLSSGIIYTIRTESFQLVVLSRRWRMLCSQLETPSPVPWVCWRHSVHHIAYVHLYLTYNYPILTYTTYLYSPYLPYLHLPYLYLPYLYLPFTLYLPYTYTYL